MKANRFRFRVFDGQTEVMVDDVLPMTDRVYYKVVDRYKCTLDERWGEPEYMQSTGLLDKNGKEVFEGDVVRCNREGYKTGNFADINAVVSWSGHPNARFIYDVIVPETEQDNEDYGYYSEYNTCFPCTVEVIGNVHENPELLEA